MDDDGSRISPTAHYTGQTWVQHAMSDPSLATPEGRLLYTGLRPIHWTLTLLGQPTLDGFLLARHRTIDAYLTEAIEDGSVSQVIELACGLSPRGLRFHRRYGDRITYIEGDLPHMAALKRQKLEQAGSLDENHRVVVLDALADEGPNSLAALTSAMDPNRGTALVTEGLINYFDQSTAESAGPVPQRDVPDRPLLEPGHQRASHPRLQRSPVGVRPRIRVHLLPEHRSR